MSDFQLTDLLSNLTLAQQSDYVFTGCSPEVESRHVFGGQVLAQALYAAIATVPKERRPHSMHAYFLRPGQVDKPIVYEVDPIRDGGSFTTRRVVAKQDGKAIFNTSMSKACPWSWAYQCVMFLPVAK